MSHENVQINHWEKIESQRSASEAERRKEEDLLISGETLERYLSPPVDTNFPLEYSYHLLGDVTGKTVVDYGCGTGENSVHIAHHGGNVKGIDISPELIELAKERVKINNVADKTEFMVGSAYEMPLPDESVDVVLGLAILHHLDLELASKEVFRVLKKGGRAIFQEPVRNSKFVGFVRNLIPYKEPDLSPFERPLTDEELKEFAKDFSDYKSREFYFPVVNLVRILPGLNRYFLQSVDVTEKILQKVPSLKYYSTVRVVEMTK